MKWFPCLFPVKLLLFSLAILCFGTIYGQTSKPNEKTEESEPFAIGELGGAANWDIKGFAPSGGPSIAVEFTPIKEWLEIEFGGTESYSKEGSELSFDLLFKKPFTISRVLEFMAGGGPEFSSMRSNGRTANTWAGEIAMDFMYWPFKTRRIGFYAEPAYDYSFASGNEQSIGVSGGLLFSIN